MKWRPELAYATGLMVTDGNLSSNRRHLTFVSKDMEQIKNFMECLGLKVKIGETISGYTGRPTHRVQFGDVEFYAFLISIGLMPAKSKIIREVQIPPEYFWDYLRGAFDGDGCFYSYWDPRWRSSHMYYLTFASASKGHISWLREEIYKFLGINGHISKSKHKGSIYSLRYAKKEALVIIKKMYYNRRVVCLSRKKKKIEKALAIEKKQQKLYF